MWKLIGKHTEVGFGVPFLDGLHAYLPGASDYKYPFRSTRMLDPPPKAQRVANALSGLHRVFPSIGDVKITRSWAGAIDVTPDMIPVLGTAESLKGLVIATGFSGHGFMLGPITGKLMSEIILQDKASLDINPFRLSRFVDGSSVGPRMVI